MQELITKWLKAGHFPDWAWNLILVAGALVLGLALRLFFSLFIRKKAIETGEFSLFRSIIQHLGRPASVFFPLFFFNLALPVLRAPAIIRNKIDKIVEIALTITFAWILIRIISIAQDFVLHFYDIKKADNLRERRIRTQLQFLRRFLVGLIVLLTIAAVLLSFETMRRLGAGLLTGVGIGGIIVGFAAQRSLGNLLAGFQIAFTQPIRIDDAVIVENEYGTIEEITLTYVVVKIWDERRMILPINYFIEKPFQNWTRTSAQLLGTVYLYTDYMVPMEALRGELDRLLKSSPLWDGRAKGMVMTDVKNNTVEVRALMSAANSGALFDLRCFVRESLIDFIRKNYPDSLPRLRVGEISKNELSNKAQNV